MTIERSFYIITFMEIIIDDGLLYKDAKNQMQKRWLLKERWEGESYKGLERRLQINRTTIRKLLGPSFEAENNAKQELTTGCVFCGTKEEIVIHHIFGRMKTKTIYLCNPCHIKFHGLNKSYNSQIRE